MLPAACIISLRAACRKGITRFLYLNYVSHVTLTVEDGQVSDVQGELIPIDSQTPEAPLLAQKVQAMQTALEAKYPERFEVLGEVASLIDNAGINLGETGIGNPSTGSGQAS